MRALKACLVTLLVLVAFAFPRASSAQNFFALQQKLVPGNPATAPEAGFSVALSADGNTALVGGPADNDDAGAAWVYTRSGGTWTQQGAKLVGSGVGGGAGAEQGYSVALSADGNTALIGGPLDDASESGGVGAAWVFVRANGVWTQQGAKLVGSGATGIAGQGVGVALSADGNTALIGGYQDNGGIGAAWVFTRSGSTWTQQGAKLVGSGSAGLSEQGFGIALSGDGMTALIGGPGDDALTGATWVFVSSNGAWTQQGAKLVGAGSGGTPLQGLSVRLSEDGNTAVAGGPYDNGNKTTGGTGAVWVFGRANGTWTAVGGKLVATGALGNAGQGYAVALSSTGNILLEGAPFDDGDPINGGAGAAFVFALENGVWTQQPGKLAGTGAVGNAGFGTGVALSQDGGTALVGGFSDSGHIGAAWTFTAASAFNMNQHGLTGSWFNPATAGQGVEIEVYPDLVSPGVGFIQAAWFTYDYVAPGAAASQRWYTFSGNVASGAPSASLILYQNIGGNFDAAPATTATPVGTVTLSAADCDHVSMAYTFSDGSGRSGMVPMTRLLPNVTCVASGPETPSADFGYSGNWFNSATPGQGIVFELNPVAPQAWLTWYTYAGNGASQGAAGQRWYTAQQSYTPGARSVTLTIYETTGGLFNQPTPSPTTVPVGTATATFASCAALALNFNFTAGSNAGATGTIDMTRVGPTPAICAP